MATSATLRLSFWRFSICWVYERSRVSRGSSARSRILLIFARTMSANRLKTLMKRPASACALPVHEVPADEMPLVSSHLRAVHCNRPLAGPSLGEPVRGQAQTRFGDRDSPATVSPMSDRLCLLTVHAHPDDEASKGACTVARYHAEGVRTVLVCCTGGEEGDILNPAMDTPEVRADIAGVRREELDRCCRDHRIRPGGHARIPRLGDGGNSDQRRPPDALHKPRSTRLSAAWWR